MSRNQQLRKVLLCLGMEAAALMGAPMRPDDVEDLLEMRYERRSNPQSTRSEKILKTPQKPIRNAGLVHATSDAIDLLR